MESQELGLENILKNCYFVPKSTMKKVIELMEAPIESNYLEVYCKRNIFKLQQSKTNSSRFTTYCDTKYKTVYRAACSRAIYSHNWNRLLYLLKKCPPWEHEWRDHNESALYVRALLILLMYHPTSQAQGLLNEYLHFVWSCRTDGDKKAVLKILLTLPERLHAIAQDGSKTI